MSDRFLMKMTPLGFHCEEHDNPADFFLDVITSCEKVGGNNEVDSGFQGRSMDTNLVYDCIVIVHNIAVVGPKLLLCKDIDRF